MPTQLVTCEEIADIVFNSEDSDLNDLLCRVIKGRKYNIQQLFIKIAVSINGSLPYNVRMGTATESDRHMLLQEKIRLDLTYYAIHSELSTEPAF